MKVSTIINDDMTLEEKLAAIDAAVQSATNLDINSRMDAAKLGLPTPPPLDPADMFMCEGCQ